VNLKKEGVAAPTPPGNLAMRLVTSPANKIIVGNAKEVKLNGFVVVGAVLPLERREGWHRCK
jgi:hypothetical protein